MRLSPLLLLSLASALIAQTPAPSTAGSEEAAVRAVVDRYLHGLKFNDTLALRDAFWPEAKLFFVARNGDLGQLTQAAWYKSFAGNIGKEEQGDLRIAAVEVTRDIASVKVIEDYAKSRYIDYLSLVKWQGRWRIVNKIYTSEPR